jgi:hypothetical protein
MPAGNATIALNVLFSQIMKSIKNKNFIISMHSPFFLPKFIFSPDTTSPVYARHPPSSPRYLLPDQPLFFETPEPEASYPAPSHESAAILSV